MGMKTGFGGMAIAALTHLFYCVVLAVFARYRAAMSSARRPRRRPRFDLATICLAFAFLFSGAVGSMAQQKPTIILDELTGTFDGKEPFSVSVQSSEPVVNFDAADITVVHTGDDLPAGCEPEISTFQQSTIPGNRERYTFTVTPKAPRDIVFTVGTNFQDLDGNKPIAGSGRERTTRYDGPVIYAVPEANAGPDQLNVTPGELVTLAGSGTSDDCLRSITGYAWTRTSGTANLSAMNVANPTFTADALDPSDADATHVFSLIVTDDAMVPVASAADTVTVTVSAAPPDRQRPTGAFVSPPSTHDGTTPFTMIVEFDEDITGFAIDDIRASLQAQPGETETARSPTLSDFKPVPSSSTHYTFTVTPRGPVSIRVRVLDESFQDLADNPGRGFGVEEVIRYGGPALPVADAGPDRTVASGTKVTLDGSGSTSGREIVSWDWEQVLGTTGVTAPMLKDEDTSMPSFTAKTLKPVAADVIYIFRLIVEDELGRRSSPNLVTVRVTAPPFAEAGPDKSVVSEGVVTLDGSGTASDSVRTVEYAWTRTSGTGGTLADANTLTPRFTAPALNPGDAPVRHEFRLTVTDDVVGSTPATDTVTVTVESGFVAPVAIIAGGDRSVASGATEPLDGSGSTHDDRTTLTYAWTRADGTTTGLTNADMAMASFRPPTLADGATDATHELTLTVTEVGVTGRTPQSATAMVTITVESGFVAPVAIIAGGDRSVASGATEPLDGSGSTHDDRTTLTYAWTRADGTTTGLTNADMAMASFRPPTLADGATDATHELTLTVTEVGVTGRTPQSATAMVTITVESGFVAPVAIIAGGDRSVASGATEPLDGSGSTHDDRTTLTYAWTRADGTTTGLTNADMAMASFRPPTLADGDPDATHELTLTVTEVGVTGRTPQSATAMVTITVESGFVAPVAIIAGGDRSVASGATEPLDGSGSTHDDRTTLTYAWTRADGTTTGLTNADMAMASFRPPTLADGDPDATHELTLTVTEVGVTGRTPQSATAMVTITVESGFVAPVAIIAGGDRSVASGATEPLDGSGSTHDDRTTLTYAWTRADGTTTGLTNADMAMASFRPPTLADGATDATHELTLTVTEVGVTGRTPQSATAMVTITVESGFVAPVAIIAGGDRSVASGATEPLDGSGSTHDDRTTLTYAWTRADGTTTGLTNADMAMASFRPPTLADGATDATHELTLTVTEVGVTGRTPQSATAMVTITVESGFVAPVAIIAGGDRSVASGATEPLDGSGSTHDDRTTLTYAWTRADGTTTGLTNADMAMASFRPPTLADGDPDATHELTLTVTEVGVTGRTPQSATAMVTITVESGFVAPVAIIAGGDRSVASGATEPLDGSGSTHDDRTTLTYAWTRADGTTTGLTNADMAMASFRPPTLADGATDATHELTLTVTEVGVTGRTPQSATAMVTITVESGFVAPVAIIAGGDRSVASGATEPLDGSGSTHDDRTTLTYAWTRADGTTTGLTNADMAMASFRPPTLADGDPDATHELTLTVTEVGVTGRTPQSATAMVTITVESGFVAPVAIIAGGDRSVASGATEPLDGSGSTHDDRTTLTYAWTRADGTTTGLTNADMAMASFRPPTLADGATDATHELTLTVTEVGVTGRTPQSATAMVTITVESGFVAPVAIIAGGDRSVASGATEPLDGSGSTHDDRTTLTYAWTRADGTTTGLTNADMAMASFRPPTLADGDPDATHELTLTVTEVGVTGRTPQSATAMVTITVESGFVAPVAIIAGGDRSVASGATEPLDGSGSTHDDRTTLTYAWTRADGTTTGLTNADMAMASFRPPTLADGDPDATHELTLTVTEVGVTGRTPQSATAMVTITVESGFVAPVAIIAGGDRSVASGATEPLDGSGSTHDDRTTLTYAWTRADGTTTGLTNADMAMASFRPPTLADGATDATHELTLTVTEVGVTGRTPQSATAMVTITVESGFVAPVAIIAGGDRSVASGATEPLDGSGSTHDDRTTLTYAWTRADGTTTGLTNADMAMASFRPPTLADGATDATHELTLTVTEVGVTGRTPQSATAMVTITVESGFVAPVAIIAGGDRSVASGATEPLDGSGSTHDDRTTLTYAWTRADGTTTGLTNADMAMASFRPPTLADGDPDATHELTLTVTEVGVTGRTPQSATAMVTITVESGFVAPVAIIAGGDRSVASGATEPLDGSGSTHDDRTTLTYAWTRADGTTTGLTNADMAMASFRPPTLADGATDATHELTLTVTEVGVTGRTPQSATAMVTITVESGFVAPVAIIAGGDRSVASGATEPLDGSGSTHDDRTTLTYAWTRADGTTTGLTNADMAMASFRPPTLADGATDATHELTLTVTEVGVTGRTPQSATAMVTITVESGFVAPVAIIAGGDRSVASGATEPLDGSGSTHDDRTTLTYAWTRADGTTTGLTNADMAMASFRPPTLADGDPDATHELTLTVTEVGVTGRTPQSATAMVTITVESGFVAPVAIIAGGDRSVASGATEPLDGSGSTHDDRTTLTYAWTRADGTTTGLTNADMAMASFRPPTLADGATDATHELTLTVTEVGVTGRTPQSATAMVTITVESGFVAPVAIIAGGDRSVASGATEPLDGSGSTHDDRTTLTYAWTRADGTTTGLTNADMAMASFRPPTLADGDPDATHELTLTVTEVGVTGRTPQSATAMVTITVESGFVAPVAIIAGGNRSVTSGTLVMLESTGSSVDRRRGPISYTWTGMDGTMGGSVTLIGERTATASFTPELVAGVDDETYTFTLMVTDSANKTATDTVMITVTSGFADPVAMIAGGNRSVASGTLVTLESTGSSVDRRRGPISYTWTGTDGTMGGSVALTDERTATASFTPELVAGAEEVTHILTLTVTDSANETATATVEVTVTSEVAETVANAAVEGEEPVSVIRVPSGTRVTLDGTGSVVDYRREPASYLWVRTHGTPDASVDDLTGADTKQPSFTADILKPGAADVTHVFTLTVTDSTGARATDTVTVVVFAVAQVDIHVSRSELTVQEGSSGTYRVRLSESPGREVIVKATSDDEDVVLEKMRLTFDADNWNRWQEVRITTVADSDNQNYTARIRHTLVDAVGVTLGTPVIVTVTIREVDPILRPIGEFLAARATALINTQPDLTRFIKQDGTTQGGGGSFTFRATDGRLALDGGFIHNGVWGEVTGSRVNSESGDTRSVLASFGIHRKYSRNFLAGALLQLDLAENERAALNGRTGTINGTGWLAGPYFAARHDTQPLYFEGRLLYGQSDNDIRFMDTGLGVMRTGSFDTRRLLAQVRVEGEIALSGREDGETGPRLIPYADARWTEYRANAFTDNGGIRVPGQKVSMGQLELGSNVEIPIAMRTGAMTLTGGLGLVWSNTKGDHITSDSGGRGRGEIGFSYDLDDTLRIGFESFYDGIGSSRYESYGLSLSAEMKF